MDISSSLFYNNEELKRVDLTNGKSSIPSQLFIPLPKVEWLSLDGNFIPVLTPLLLRKKKKLEYLTMAECEIEAVLDSTFHEAKSLQILIMRNNNIKYLTAGQLKGLENLQHIGKHEIIHDSAKNCDISLWFTRPMRKTWFKFTFSDLSSNHLESIGGDMFIESPFLSSIDLSSNTSLFSICRSSFVRHEFLQTGIVRHFILRGWRAQSRIRWESLSVLWRKSDVDDWFKMLVTDLLLSHQHNEKSHIDTITNILRLSPSSNQQHNVVTNITVSDHCLW